MNCPWCKTVLETAVVGPITVDHCPRCGAQWFERTELAAALGAEVPGVAVDWGTPTPRRDLIDWPACPRDGGRLVAYHWLKTEFGRCEHCRGILISDANWNQLLRVARLLMDQRGQRLGAFSLIEVIGEALALFDY